MAQLNGLDAESKMMTFSVWSLLQSALARGFVGSLVILTFASPVTASIVRIELTKANQATSPVKYTLTTSTSMGLITVQLDVPRKQSPLDHLWRIDVVLRKGDNTLLVAPLQTTLADDTLSSSVVLDPASMADAEIWIRTGPAAPLAETVYVLRLGTFK